MAMVEFPRVRAAAAAVTRIAAMAWSLMTPPCSHAHWDFRKHGRYCTCGVLIVDPGD
jgi:hypothetical protein